MDIDLPVWTIRPNWKAGILERLEWVTDVLTSDTGVEQRRSVRLSPRRSFEFTVNPTRAERTYLDLVLHRLGSEEWMLPLWHDQAKLTQDYAVDGASVYIDNTFREYEDDGFALLYLSTFEWEVVQIDTQYDNRLFLDVAGRSAKAWPTGTKVYPLRRCTVQTETSLKALTGRVGEAQILFQVNAANDYPEMAGDAMLNYMGSPLLVEAPDRSKEITTDHVRLYDEIDGELGLRYRTDRVNRAFAVQSHNWQIKGREKHAAFRSFLYTLRGRQRMVWLPSFNEDIFLAQPVAQGAVQARIEACGMGFVGGGSPIPGRARVWTGTEVLRIASILAPGAAGEERVGLTGPTTAAYAPGASWGFLEAARLDQDAIELHHHTDSDGVMECAAGFKTFANDRDTSGSNFLPIPESGFTVGQCGAPLGLNPCRYVPFDGIFLSVVCGAPNPCNAGWDGDRYLGIVEQRPNGPNGQIIGTHHMPFNGNPLVFEIYEVNNPGLDIRLQGQLLYRYTQTDFNNWHAEYFFPCQYLFCQITFSSRYCGSVGKDEGTMEVVIQYADGGPISLGVKPVGGLYTVRWE